MRGRLDSRGCRRVRGVGVHDKPSKYPPHVLREYVLLADGERGAVLGPRGDIVWMCVPRWDSDAVFSALIGGRGGYAITPVQTYVWGGYYEQDSLIWRSRWVTTTGTVECREALAFPADPDRAVLLRRVEAVDGDASVRVTLEPRGQYGSRILTGLAHEAGVWTARTAGLHVRWTGAAEARIDSDTRQDRSLTMDLVVPAGQSHDLVLEIGTKPLPDDLVDPSEAWSATEGAWRAAIPRLTSCLSPPDTRHSYAVLRGMTSTSGGMVAAATTSLPERAEAGRNYDYRYVWIRDQCYAGQAVAALGEPALLDDAVRFVGGRLLEHGDRLAPAYTTRGERVPDQRELDLPGYPGGADIIGNWVNSQFQLDAFGESLLLFAAAGRLDRLDTEGWKAASIAAAAIAARWTEPDAGIWEIDNRPWTHSRLTCAAGLRAIAAVRPSSGDAVDWLSLADRIVADTSEHALNPASGSWQRSRDDACLDAALLLPGLRGAVAADDPRTIATLAAYTRDLTQHGYAYRFRQDDRPLGQAEGAFQFCGFLMALATHQQGDILASHGWYERTRSACGPPQLFCEEYDVAEHQMRGNFPQAFVHALMVEAAARLASDPEHPSG
jgi:GH15 family glucan-1,4-alpha-glucosidase